MRLPANYLIELLKQHSQDKRFNTECSLSSAIFSLHMSVLAMIESRGMRVVVSDYSLSYPFYWFKLRCTDMPLAEILQWSLCRLTSALMIPSRTEPWIHLTHSQAASRQRSRDGKSSVMVVNDDSDSPEDVRRGSIQLTKHEWRLAEYSHTPSGRV